MSPFQAPDPFSPPRNIFFLISKARDIRNSGKNTNHLNVNGYERFSTVFDIFQSNQMSPLVLRFLNLM